MRTFLDTNVILEFFLDREAGSVAASLFARLREEKHELMMSAGSFYTMIFLVDKYLHKERGLSGEVRLQVLRELMTRILRDIHVAGHDNVSLLQGIRDAQFRDLEDSCQYQAAIKEGCGLLVTFNTDDFPANVDDAPVRVLSPEEFLKG